MSCRGRRKATRSHESVQVAKWCEAAGADAIHVSTGSLFPHPLNPPGDFSFETITATYDAMISSGVSTLRNYFLFRYPMLRPIFYWAWFRMKRGRPIEGVGEDEARAIKAAVNIPVISTGGWQTASKIRAGDQFRCLRRRFDRAFTDRQSRSAEILGRGRRSAAVALHLLQSLPAQRAEKSDGLLRAAALRQP